MDVYDLICVAEVVVVFGLAGLLWPLARRIKGPWLREWLCGSIVFVTILAPLVAVIARDPVWSVGSALILGPLFALGLVVPEAQIAHLAEQAQAARQGYHQKRDEMRALFRRADKGP